AGAIDNVVRCIGAKLILVVTIPAVEGVRAAVAGERIVVALAAQSFGQDAAGDGVVADSTEDLPDGAAGGAVKDVITRVEVDCDAGRCVLKQAVVGNNVLGV